MILAVVLASCSQGAAPIQDARWVRLVDAYTGAGLAGVVVLEDPMSDGVFSSTPKPEVRLGVTDEGGFLAHRNRRGIARVEASGYTTALYSAQLGRPTRDAARVIEVLRDADLTIEVLDAEGETLEGVRVRLEGSGYFLMQRNLLGGAFPEDVRLEQITDSDGRAEFSSVPAECPLEVTLIDVAPSGAWESTRPTRALVLGAGEERTTRYRIGALHDVVGRVVGPEGKPLADTPLALRRGKIGWPKLQRGQTRGWLRATADAAGEFRFADVPDGDWWIGVEPRWGTGPALAFTISDDRAPDPLSIQHWPAGRVSGRGVPQVLEAGGEELTEVYAHLSPVGHVGPSLNLRSDARARFHFEGLPPGAYELTVSKNGFGRGVARVAAGDSEVEVALEPQGRVRGRVPGHLAENTVVESIDILGPSRQGSGASDGIDTFDFSELRAGTYSLVAVTSDARVGLVSGLKVEEGETLDDVELSLAPGALLRVHWSGSETYGRVHISVDGQSVAKGDVHRGTTQAFAVPPGDIEVELTGDGNVTAQTVTLGAWAESRLDFPPRR